MGPNLIDWLSYKTRSGHRYTQREDHVRTQREVGISKPRRETSEETNPTDTLTSDFHPPGL